ncbi:MAG TPA: PKD domain-containing protein, partial [Flavisolibacter sp.]|nr:PKD domain-containing protein [Flavisolibacter sp.]
PPLIPSIETRRAVSGFMVLDTAGSMGDCLAVKDSLAIQRGSVAIAPITLSFSDAPQAVTVGFGSMFPVNNSTVFEKDSCVSKRGPRSKFGVYSTTNGSDIINVVCTQTAVTFFDSSYWEPQTWQWVFPPEADLSAADSSCYPTVRNVRFTQAGVFPVQLITQNESGTDTTTINVTVINFIPQPLLGNDTTICEGDSVRLVYTPVENSGHYFLKLGGGFFSTEDTVFIKQGGAYICAAFSPCGFRYDTINITVLRRPLARFGYSDSCGRLQVFFSDSSETGGSAGMEYRWEFFDKNDIELGSSALQNPSFTFPSFDTVRVRLIINSGQPCLFADTVWQTIVLRPKPVASFTTTETCGSLTASFSNSSSIAAGSIVRHHWAFGDGNSSSALEPVHTFPSFSSFPVKLVVESGAGCLSDTVSQTLTIRAKPQASITYNNDACESQAFTLVNTASAEASTIQDHYWRILPTAQVFTTPGIEPSLPAGSYTVQYTALSAQGCPSDTVQKLITVESIPSVSLRDTSGCTGTALALSAEVLQPFGSIASYSWQAGDQSSTESSPSFSFTAAGSYPIQLTVQSLNGCTGTGSAITEIEAIPRPSFNYSPPCLGEEVRFTNTSDGIASFAWQWSINASPVSQAPSLSYTFPSAGEYTVSLRGLSPGGCTASVSKTVRVADFSLSLSASQNPAYEGDELRIETRAALPYSVVGWQPAFLFSTSSAISQQVTADSTRLYQVVAEAAGGCRDTASVLVRVEPLDDVYIPSAFTPNGDGLNDVLRVVGAGMSEFSFAIYNRWGRVVYHSRNKGEGWNGQLNGSPAPAGSYAYLLQATKGDKKILKRGTVTLIR